LTKGKSVKAGDLKTDGEGAYKGRLCRVCERKFRPRYPNQRTHETCGPKLRRKRNKAYQRKARRDIRRELDAVLE